MSTHIDDGGYDEWLDRYMDSRFPDSVYSPCPDEDCDGGHDSEYGADDIDLTEWMVPETDDERILRENLAAFNRRYPFYRALSVANRGRWVRVGSGRYEVPQPAARAMERAGLVVIMHTYDDAVVRITGHGTRYMLHALESLTNI